MKKRFKLENGEIRLGYQYKDLDLVLQEKIIERYRESNQEYFPFLDEVNDSLNKFCELFNVKYRNIDYLEPYRNDFRIEQEDRVLELTGWRLATYIWNNYRRQLWKGQHYSKTISVDPYKYVHRYSKIILRDRACALTGVTYDESLLDPLYRFMDAPNDRTSFEELIIYCISSLCTDVQKEAEYRDSEEAIVEDIEANCQWFDGNGKPLGITYFNNEPHTIDGVKIIKVMGARKKLRKSTAK